MIPYNRFKRNNAQVIQRYNAPSIRHNAFSESCRMTQRRTHWAFKTRAEAQAIINRDKARGSKTRRNYYIQVNTESSYPYAVGFESWTCSTPSTPTPRPQPQPQPQPKPTPGHSPVQKESTWDKIINWFRGLWNKIKGDQSDSSVIDYLKDKWWLVLVGIIVVLGIMR